MARPRISVTPRETISMAMSIALVLPRYNPRVRMRIARRSSRQDERQPRGRELQLCRVRDGFERRRRDGRRDGASLETGRDLLQRATRGDLRAPPLVHVDPCALPLDVARFGARGFERGEPRLVPRLERELSLKPLLGRGVERGGGAERALAIELQPVALEAERPPWAREPAIHRVPALRAYRLRAFAFELSAREANPLLCGES